MCSLGDTYDTTIMALRILIVEAERHAREGLRAILVAGGHDVSVAADVRTAFERLVSGPFDVLLLDTDIALSRNLLTRTLNLLRVARIARPAASGIVLTSCADDLPRDLAAHGVGGVLEKPVEIPRLLRALEAVEAGREPAPVPGEQRVASGAAESRRD